MKKILLAASLAALTMMGCSEDDNVPTTGGSGAILIETAVKNPTGDSGSSFLKLNAGLAGALDNTDAIQIGFQTSISVIDNEVFLLPTFGKDGSQDLRKYEWKDNKLTFVGKLHVDAGAVPQNIIKITEDKYYMPCYSIGSIWIVNPKTMKKTGEIDISKYGHKDLSPNAASGIIRDGFYYLSLDQVGSNWMPYPDHEVADVLIIDIKTDKAVKLISETTSGLSFPTRPMLKNMIFTDEKKDIYIACTGYFGMNPKNLKNGFVCIPNGKQEFDASKSWDISTVNIEGTQHKNAEGKDVYYKSAALLNSMYVGGGKAVAFVTIPELTGKNIMTAISTMAVLVDFNAKTVKKLEGMPMTDAHSVVLDKYQGKVLLGAFGDKQTGFYTYDPATESVAFLCSVVGNPIFFHSFE